MELNKIPVKTTNGFNINDLKIDLELPKEQEFKEYNSNIKVKYRYDKCDSKIGLSFKKSLTLDLEIDKAYQEDIIFTYNYPHLVSNINIHFLKNSKANIIFKYNGDFNFTKLNIISDKESTGNISIINKLSKTNIIASESIVNGYLKQNLLDISGNTRIYNFYSEVNENATSILNNVYIGKNNDLIDMNYNYINKGINSNTNINVEGVLSDNATKNFRGTIDFIKGSSNSIGSEKENCILLSDTAISKSVPLLLCGEEDVTGSHAVSNGKPDPDKLFYLMTKGFSLDEATKLIIMGNFEKLLGNLVEEIDLAN